MGTHLAEDEGPAPQSIASSPDQTLSPGAQAQILPANPRRVSALLQNTGANPARVGDTTTGAGTGLLLGVNGPPVEIATNDPIFGYSVAGTTVNCTEIFRD